MRDEAPTRLTGPAQFLRRVVPPRAGGREIIGRATAATASLLNKLLEFSARTYVNPFYFVLVHEAVGDIEKWHE